MPTFHLTVNGRVFTVDGQPGDTLLSILREDLNLTGTKYGCGEGQCGACTVLVDGLAVRSCVARIGTLSGRKITTIEGLADGELLHPVQAAFLETEAFQCGYCTTGMVMATVGLLRSSPSPSVEDIHRLLDRNVCRCGTYPRIVKAVQLAASRVTPPSSAGER
jgi:aerobic-type carbon monoxide dehydrogenase small subunit (CoxS/CutS family)